ncbi:PilZ domain-containing protein [Sphingosinicella sp. BN140058]|uniref:PilZ domain-containing protein n=1 Tax=Sphingosinicella sp. BN140058 TaxID=1892855 RepID=UPI00101117C8|nr:PilZ domain-containing protein [Sphingosinicella sp. BN140058]QAY76350.1 PilZ domain-containing protein [Sphingosinicella sp. BN140058]
MYAELERRAGDRIVTRMMARFRLLGASPWRVDVIDLSPTGCAVAPAFYARVEETVWIRFPGLESWEARIRWVASDKAGLEFTRPLHPAVLSHLLGKLQTNPTCDPVPRSPS